MKKLLVFLLSMLMVFSMAMILSSCGDSDDSDDKSSSSSEEKDSKKDKKEKKEKKDKKEKKEKKDEDEDEDEDDEIDAGESASFTAPADAVKIDMNADDPSNDEIEFDYDDEGRVTECIYSYKGEIFIITYDYDADGAEVYAFSEDGVVLAEKTIKLSDFDPDKGFAKIDGYYFKGYKKG